MVYYWICTEQTLKSLDALILELSKSYSIQINALKFCQAVNCQMCWAKFDSSSISYYILTRRFLSRMVVLADTAFTVMIYQILLVKFKILTQNHAEAELFEYRVTKVAIFLQNY